MADAPTLESPVVREYPLSESGALTLCDASAITKWIVRASTDGAVANALGVAFGSSNVAPSGALILGSRPGEWMVLGTQQQVSAVVADLDTSASGEFVSSLDGTHCRAMFRLTGAVATSCLEKVCGIDWSDHMTPNGAVTSASVALVTCDLARNDQADTPSYLIFCDRSLGQYLFDALIDAGNEFSLQVTAPSIT